MSPLTKGFVMNVEPGGNKSFQERQATVLYTPAPLLSVTFPLPTEATETNKQNQNERYWGAGGKIRPVKSSKKNWGEKEDCMCN